MPSGSIVEPAAEAPFAPAAPGATPPNTGTPLTSAQTLIPEPAKKSHRNIIEIIIIVVLALISIVFIWLYIQKYIDYDTISTDVQGQIDAAVAMAVAENTTKMEEEFLEREKYPYKNFMGPIDYGSLTFEYPKTWSVYVAKDATSGGDFEAYLNPGEVEPVSNQTINALRVTIRNTSFDQATRSYDNYLRNGRLTLSTRNVGGALANIYVGELPSSIHGVLAMFKLRDKTVMLQTDADVFAAEFYKLLDTVSFVE